MGTIGGKRGTPATQEIRFTIPSGWPVDTPIVATAKHSTLGRRSTRGSGLVLLDEPGVHSM